MLKRCGNLVSMASGTHEDRNARVTIPRNDVGCLFRDELRLSPSVFIFKQRDMDAGMRRWLIARQAVCFNVPHPTVMRRVLCAHEFCQRLVNPRHNFWSGSKVLGQGDRLQRDAGELPLSGSQKQRHIGVSKPINRLHCITDNEQGSGGGASGVVFRPTSHESLQKLCLRRRGVLKLINENMLDLVIQPLRQWRRHFIRAQRLNRC